MTIGDGLASVGAEADLCPVADGGEGTAETLLAAVGGEVRTTSAHDPLGRAIEAEFILLEGRDIAVVDTAAASGLPLIPLAERDADAATSYGTGEVIASAIEAGAKRILVAAGGSATTDGGLGAIEALRQRGGLFGASLTILCDVSTRFEDAASVFAPQKGAGPAAVIRLSARLQQFAADLPRDPRGVPMGGCAGGLSGGLWAAFDAELRPGAAFVLQLVAFGQRLQGVDAVITGEGQLDFQSFEGKIVGQIAAACATQERDLHIVVGRNALDQEAIDDLPIRSIREAGTMRALREFGVQIGQETQWGRE